MNYTWEEVKNSVNHIFKRHNTTLIGTDVVNDVYLNHIARAINSALVMDCVKNIRDEHTLICINGYLQLEEKGYIGDLYGD